MGALTNYFKRSPAAVQDTSKDALVQNEQRFISIETQIVDYLALAGGIHTRAEIAKELDLATATCSGRVNALLKGGKIVEEPGRYPCSVTGNMVRGVSIA